MGSIAHAKDVMNPGIQIRKNRKYITQSNSTIMIKRNKNNIYVRNVIEKGIAELVA